MQKPQQTVASKAANLTLGGAIAYSAFLGLVVGWGGYSAASAHFGLNSPGTMQNVVASVKAYRNNNGIQQSAVSPVVITAATDEKQEPKTPDRLKKADPVPKSAAVERNQSAHQQSKPKSNFVYTYVAPDEKPKPTAKAPVKTTAQPVVAVSPTGGDWVSALMPGETKKTGKYSCDDGYSYNPSTKELSICIEGDS